MCVALPEKMRGIKHFIFSGLLTTSHSAPDLQLVTKSLCHSLGMPVCGTIRSL